MQTNFRCDTILPDWVRRWQQEARVSKTRHNDKLNEPGPMRRVLRNFGYLFRGRAIAAVLSLGATTLMARALGPAEFGLVAMIQAYALLLRGLLNFQPFEAVVRYGVPAHDAGDTRALRRLIKVCRRVDRRASLVATALAIIAAPFIGPSLGMDRDHVMLLAAYSLVLLTTGNGTANGILRLYDEFDALGRQMAIGPVIRFCGVTVAWWYDSTLAVFVAILAVAYAAENIYLSWRGRHEYRKRIGRPQEGETVRDAGLSEFPGLRHFLWVTYWQSNIDLAYKYASIMLVGYLLGPAEAGLLRLVRELSSVLSKPSALIRQVIFPDLTRSWNQGSDAFKQVTYRTALVSGGFGLLFVLVSYVFGDALLNTLLGKDFAVAAPILTLMLLAASFDLATAPLRAAAYATGNAGKVLLVNAVTTLIYIVLFVLLTLWIGLIGAGFAACVAATLPPLFMLLLIRRSSRGKKD
ncbi:MAG: hypothetical protein CO069_00035 [Gallionellaceae bacterium CG_4_9_14_0_8_um_filter_60_335]|nr:lipopolysaccharide biosynthesis protein [Gallionella sp.]OIO10021.1 MAG: hypothetical protein AUJ80_03740 [Gallionellaceae bacterium CG1_02_60_325]PIR09084.1 MAG: hypothetical protein COV51_06290 [Gallionellaceae bacterium CG11_big_fil_rev_8_21_14_0_20_60_62]PIV47795.1 MAG: hypothetical protein COS20_02980 [Gallionellaceae bacterium CG02_land_8_20_14_3_00_60_115]PJC05428.1 MAG: hypothetical protein CO069_00035 [Gallionellaceae bacterium CG_4_9_14_0_8_um_filter_60_335]